MLVACLLTLTATSASAQELGGNACGFTVNTIEKQGPNGFTIYFEAIAVDCKNKDQVYETIRTALEQTRKAFAISANPMKSSCYLVPSFSPVNCKDIPSQPLFLGAK